MSHRMFTTGAFVHSQFHVKIWVKVTNFFPSMQILMTSAREECEIVVRRVVFCLFIQENSRSQAVVEALNVIIICNSTCIPLKLSSLSNNLSLKTSISLLFLNLDILFRNGIHWRRAAVVSSLVIQLLV